MSMDTNNRYLAFDLTRVFCVIYIVCIWHLNSYLSAEYTYVGSTMRFLHSMTEVVLGTFTFLSGYFLKRYDFSSYSDVIAFFKKRIKRFYLLLLISALTYLILRWISISQFAQIMTGTNLLFGNSAGTLWFFSMIILFYVLTPIVSYKKDTKKWIFPVVSVLIFILFYMCVSCFSADYRLLLYFPCYVAGLSTKEINYNMKTKISLILFLMITYILFYYLNNNELIWLRIIEVLCGIWILLLLSVIVYCSKFNHVVTFLATSSMVAYLFHRQFFAIGKGVCEKFLHIDYIPLIIAIALSCFTFALSYYIQITYNELIDKIWLTKKKSV